MATVDLNLIPADETQLVIAAGDDTQLVLSAGDETQIVLSSVAISNGLMMTDGSNSALALGSAGTPSLKFTGDANTGIFSPGADQLAVATNGVQRLTVDTAATTSALPVLHPLGAVGTPSITFTGDLNTGFWSPTADTLAASTAGSERLRITSAGLVGVGTSSPGYPLDIQGESGGATLRIRGGSGGTSLIQFADNAVSAQWGVITTTSSSCNIEHGSVVRFSTASSERARIDSSGRLLVGTSSARTNFTFNTGTPHLQLEGLTTTTSSASLTRNANDAIGAQIFLGKTRATSLGGNTVVNSDDTVGAVVFAGADGANITTAATILAAVDGTPGANDMPGRLVFSTTADGAASPTERMRITNYGGTLLNTTSASINTTNFGTAVGCNSTAAAVTGLLRTARNGDGTSPVFESYGSAGQFRTLGDGDAENTNNSYAGISDIKLKENIVTAGSQWDDLKALQVRKYNFKAETGYNTHTQIGLIAQEVELISPGLVGESVDEETGESTKSVNYSVLYMKAVKALQEAMERIEQLEVKVAALEAQ